MSIRNVVDGVLSLRRAHECLDEQDMPFVQRLEPYNKDRSTRQNALMWRWNGTLEKVLKEYTSAQYHGINKLHFGVPILRAESEEFCEMYDRLFKPQSYEWKVDFMAQPGWFPVTSLMTTVQMSTYLEHIQQHYASSVQLNFPEDLR